MRRFSSYGPIDKDLYYYAPRQELIDKGFIGFDPPDKMRITVKEKTG